MQVDFDPDTISYSQLLDIFWTSHDPTEHNYSSQYKNAIFYQNQQQKELAMASLKAIQDKLNEKVHSQVLPLRAFYIAEDYHQKYLLGSRPDLKRELVGIFPDKGDYIRSTAVTRINGYAGGHGSPERLESEIDRLGLSPEGRLTLIDMVNGKSRSWFDWLK